MTTGPAFTRRTLLLGGVSAVVAAIVAACSGSSSAPGAATSTTGSTPAGTGATPTSTTTVATKPHPPVLAAGEPANFIASGPTFTQRVALTIHTNGDLALDQKLLDAFARRQVPITAFVVGNWLDANPDWGRRLVDGGHEIANHTYTHPTFTSLSRAAMLSEVERCRDTLVRLTGGSGTFFRPSGTDDGTSLPPAVVQAVAAEAGYPVVLGFGVDPLDYQDPGSTAVAARTLAAVRAGSIVSLHFSHAGTVAAVPTILDGLAARGLTPVTVSTLLGYA
jgi:peptidoglycan/xylan/chitin deacetylase (PgdA/CDA1 family)